MGTMRAISKKMLALLLAFVMIAALTPMTLAASAPEPELLAAWQFATNAAVNNARTENQRAVMANGGAQAGALLQFIVNGEALPRVLNGSVNSPNVLNAAGTGNGGLNSALNNQGNHAWWQIALSTSGRTGINVAFAMHSPGTGPRDFWLEYSTVGGTNAADWHWVGNLEVRQTWGNDHPSIDDPANQFAFTLPAGAEDQERLYLRWVITSNRSARAGNGGSEADQIAATGASRINNIVVTSSGEAGGGVQPNVISIAQANAAASGTEVVIEGYAVGVNQLAAGGPSNRTLIVQDGTGTFDGIQVDAGGANISAHVGQIVRVTGTTGVFNSINQITTTTADIVPLRAAEIVPVPVRVEQLTPPNFRSMLVTLEGVQVLSRNAGAPAPANSALVGLEGGQRIELRLAGGAALPDDIQNGDYITIESAVVGWFNGRSAVQLLNATVVREEPPVTGSPNFDPETRTAYFEATAPGQITANLASRIAPHTISEIERLVVTGPLNNADFVFMTNTLSVNNNVREFDLSGASIAGNITQTQILRGAHRVIMPQGEGAGWTLHDRAFRVSTVGDDTTQIRYLDISGMAGDIPNVMFMLMTSLEEIILPDRPLRIGDNAFNGARSLQTIDLSQVTHLGTQAFRNTPSLTMADLSSLEGWSGWAHFENAPLFVQPEPVISALTTVILPETLKVIPSNAFRGHANLTKVNLENVEDFGAYSFYGSGLTRVDLLSAQFIGPFAFENSRNLSEIHFGTMTAPTGSPPALNPNVSTAFAGIAYGATIFYPAGATGYTEANFANPRGWGNVWNIQLVAVEVPGTLVMLWASANGHNIVRPGDYFEVSAGFNVEQESNTAIITFTFDDELFGFGQFIPGEGVQVLNTNAAPGEVHITLMVLGYDMQDLGRITLYAKEDAQFESTDQLIRADIEYVLRLADGEKVIRSAYGEIYVRTMHLPWEGEVTLIDLSNLIDWFGYDYTHEDWDSTIRYWDFNNNGTIDIYDIVFVAQLIRA